MAATFPLSIVTPERTVLSDNVSSLQVPASTGSLGILAGHAPLVADLGVGECIVKTAAGATETLVIAGGFVEISNDKVTVLADTAEFSHEIDVDLAEASLARARELLASAVTPGSTTDRTEAGEEIRRAQARIRISRGSR